MTHAPQMKKHHKGRAAGFNPRNRFEAQHLEPLDVHSEDDEGRVLPTTFLNDTSKSILARNDSPDIPFTFSVNPYRGCEHGCIYCYARPSHEFLGFSAGLDFESRILVKHDAPDLLEQAFLDKRWVPQMICLSGNTDCYQPIERKLRLTRRCLEVCLNYKNPVGIITKNALVTRDLDLLAELAKENLVGVTISLSTLDDGMVRIMEPRTSTPARRLETMKILSENGIPVTVLLAPTIPGLTDVEIPNVLEMAALHGAQWAGYVILRLPGAVEPLFVEWLNREMPDRASRVLKNLREVHGGKLDEKRFGKRMRGEGEIARTIDRLYTISCKKLMMNEKKFAFNTNSFRGRMESQMNLF